MTTSTETTEKRRRAMKALEGARSAGKTLSGYANERGLVLGELYERDRGAPA